MSKRKIAFWGLTADLGGQIITTLITFATTSYIVKSVQPSLYGYWLTIGAIMSWFAISDIGIGIALSRQLIKISNEDNNIAKKSTLISTSFFLYLIFAILFLLISILLYPYILKSFRVDVVLINDFKITYFICAFSGAISLPLTIFSSILEASQKLVLNRNISTISNILNLIFSIILILIYKNIIVLALSLFFSVIIKGILSFLYSKKNINFKITVFNFSKNIAKQIISYGGYFQIGKIANLIATNTDTIFITIFLSASIVPNYTFTSKLYQIFGIVIASKIPTAIFSGISHMIEQKNEKRTNQIIFTIIGLLVRYSIFTSILSYFLNYYFVKLWVGEYYYGGNHINILLVYLILFETLVRGTSAIIYAYGDLRKWSFYSIAESILNIFLSYVLINKLNILGLLLATVISRTFTTGVFLIKFFINKGIIDKFLFNSIYMILLKSIPTLVYFYLVSNFLNFNNWETFVAIIFLGIIVNLLSFDFQNLRNIPKNGINNTIKLILNFPN